VYRLVSVHVVLVLVVVLVLRGYPLDEITGSVLVLVTGLAAAVDRLMGIQGERVSLPLPAL
jgi:hypothetical protein